MKNVVMARDYASRSKWCLGEARTALDGENYPICIRRSQEALELATKAVLRYFGLEYPREHDVGEALPEIEGKLPGYVKEKVPELRGLLTELASIRGPAFYGYEREGIPASKAFGAERAREVYEKVKVMVETCLEFLEED